MTTDRPPIEHVIEDTVAGMSDDALAECIIDTGEEAERLTRMVGQARHALIKRMVDRNATVLDVEHWTGALTPGAPSNSFDDEKMETGLRSVLNPEELALTRFQPPAPPARWDKNYLNKLAKRGGAIREAIEDATTTMRGAPRLKLERKEAAE